MNSGIYTKSQWLRVRRIAAFLAVLAPIGALAQTKEPNAPQPAVKKGIVAEIEASWKAKRTDEALRTALDYLSKNPKGADVGKVSILRAEMLFSLKKDEEAMKALEWYVAHSSPSVHMGDAYEMMAAYYEKRSAPATVTALRQKLRTVVPTHPAAVKFYRATLKGSFEKEDYATVVNTVDKEGDAGDGEIKQMYLLSSAMRGNARPEALVALARQAIVSKNLALAERAYSAMVERFPEDASVQQIKVELGWVYFNSNDPKGIDKAEALWKSVAAQGKPGSDAVGDATWHLVQTLAGPRMKWQEASELCKKIISTYPAGSSRHEQALFFRAWLFWAHKKWPAAKTAFAEFLSAYPKAALHPPIIEYVADIEGGLANAK